jgi:hypothetical protein
MRTRTWLVVLTLVTAPIPAAAQEIPHRKLIISERAIAAGMAANPPAPAQVNRGQRDSLKNGTIIGAVIGAIAMGAGVGALCKALQEPTDPSCWGSGLVGAAMGAGIGALGGLGIDALMTRSPSVPAGQREALRIR